MIASPDIFIPYGRQSINEQDIQAVTDVLRSSMLTQGPLVPEFEKAIADKVNAQYSVAVNSATSALHIACLALGLGPGDWLWTSPITFVASANCGLYCGASVDFVDINPFTGLMDISALEIKLQQAKLEDRLPKIVVPVHLAGSSCEMKSIESLSKVYGFSVVEDASHAIGGKYFDEPVGSCSHSDITVFSFHPVKIITTAEGGMATTNNQDLAQKMRDLRSHGITKEFARFSEPRDHAPWHYEQQSLGFNYRLNDIQAALGISQLERLDEFVAKRNKIYKLYQHSLADLPVKLLEIPENVYSALHLAVIRLQDQTPEFHRALFETFKRARVGVQLHYMPVHTQPYYRNLGFQLGQFPHSELYASDAISLPIYPGLSEDEQRYIVSILSNFLS